ncbi:MAG TPA: hypothetical protein VFS07_02355 [Gemmatimonadales bacterium]|jgi:hypothetical protein|nr:hypothetical protein [Gemmatimonadales bacterium]
MVPIVEALETHAGVTDQAWAATPTRPAEYPAELPFLPDHSFSLLRVAESTTVEWDGISPRAVETIARQLADARWVETTLPNASMPGMTIRIFRRDARQRVLVHDGRLLTLLDTGVE